MLEPSIDPNDLETWASILLDHSLGGVAPGERVMIKGERIAWSLMEVLERGVIAAGGVPDVYLVPPNNERGRVWSAAMAELGSADQLAAVPDWHRARVDAMVKYVEVLGAEDPAAYASLTGAQSQALAAADRPFVTTRLARRWVITLYPTPAFAAMEGLPLDEYVRFLVRASTTDPRPLKAAEDRLEPLFRAGRSIRLVTVHPDGRELTLELDIAASIPALSYGLRNFPDGEVFTSPLESETEGHIRYSFPAVYGGREVHDVRLTFHKGRVVEAQAAKNEELLKEMIKADDGASRVGELAFGTNYSITRFTKNTLFDEKIGGTMHVAIGASLPETGGRNKSGVHWDMVCDTRKGFTVYGDGRPIMKDGKHARF